MCFENIEGKFTFQKTDHIKKFTNNNFFSKKLFFLRNNEPILFSNYAQKQKVAGNSKWNSGMTFNTQQQTTVLFYKI